jgi:flagellar biosynthesis protein FlhG
VIAVTSGKGGVGKTSVVVNTAFALAGRGERVVVLDADFGLGNVDIHFGLTPRHTLQHVFFGQRRLPEIMIQGPLGIRLIPAGSGLEPLTRLTPLQESRLAEELRSLRQESDLLLIDTATGISRNVVHLAGAADGVIVVCSPDPTSVVDAYATAKILLTHDREKPVHLLVNGADDPEEAREIHQRVSETALGTLGRGIGYLGMIPADRRIAAAVRRQQPVGLLFPGDEIARVFEGLAERLLEAFPEGGTEDREPMAPGFVRELERPGQEAADRELQGGDEQPLVS